MYRMVGTVFKIIMLSIILVFVADMGFYMYRVVTLNQKIESIAASMTQVVMNNNYLPEGDYQMFSAMLHNVAETMNGSNSPYATFISGIGTNYSSHAMNIIPNIRATANNGQRYNALVDTMSIPAPYGAVMAVQIRVLINQPFWGWSNVGNNYTYTSANNASTWTRNVNYNKKLLYYNYYVPCLNYQTLQDVQ